MRQTIEVGFVSSLCTPQVQSVKSRVIEKVALYAPDLVIHLRPLLARIDFHFHLVQLEHPLPGLNGCGGCGDEKRRPLRIDHLFSIRRNLKPGHTVEDLVSLSLLELKLVKRPRTAAKQAFEAGSSLQKIQRSRFP